MSTGMDCRHGGVLHKGEFLHGEGLIKVLSLDVLSDVIIRDGGAVIVGGAKEHTRSMIELIIDDVHFILSKIFFFFHFLLCLGPLEDDDLVLFLLDDLFFYFFWLLF